MLLRGDAYTQLFAEWQKSRCIALLCRCVTFLVDSLHFMLLFLSTLLLVHHTARFLNTVGFWPPKSHSDSSPVISAAHQRVTIACSSLSGDNSVRLSIHNFSGELPPVLCPPFILPYLPLSLTLSFKALPFLLPIIFPLSHSYTVWGSALNFLSGFWGGFPTRVEF